MRQFLSDAANPTAVHTTENPLHVPSRVRKHSADLLLTMIGIASSLAVAGYCAQDHPTIAVLSSLVIGFVPLIGLCVLLLVVSLLISLLICTVEQALAVEDDGGVPAEHAKSTWQRGAPFPSDLPGYCLWLKEHSPPALRISLLRVFP